MKPYMGNEGYIFVSHAPEDTERVMPVIKRLTLGGLRVCFEAPPEPVPEDADPDAPDADEALTPSAPPLPPVQFAERIANCALFMPMLSDAYCRTERCREALAFAQARGLNTLSIALDIGIYPIPEDRNLPTPEGRVLHHTKENDTVFFERLMQAEYPDECREAVENITVDERQIADELRKDSKKSNAPANIGWGFLMFGALLLIILSANAEFRRQSVTIWAQILLVVAGVFGVFTAEPHLKNTDAPEEEKQAPAHTRFSTWAKWMTAVFGAVPLLLRFPAGKPAHQWIFGSIIAVVLVVGCRLCFPAGIDDAFAHPPLAARAFGMVWFLVALFYAGWYGLDYRFAFLTQSAGLFCMVIYQYITERSDGGREERRADLLNFVLFLFSLTGLAYAIFFYVSLIEIFNILNLR